MDWLRFLDENNIHYVTRGPNTKRGEVSIQCPMCGEDDPSEHCGINLTTGKWGCHRDASHRGKASRTLVKAILGCSSSQAGYIVKQYSQADPDTLDAALAVLEADKNGAIEHDEDLQKQAARQKLGPQFRDFNKIKPRGITARFFRYLVDRGYENPHDLIEKYDLRCALTGRYQDRIILPIRLGGELLGWTSRAITNPRNAPRYLASSEDVKTTVLDYDRLKEGGHRLFIVEGPFDAMRVDRGIVINATCTFGTSVTISQIALLRILVKQFKETWVLYDQGADGPGAELASWLGCRQTFLPEGVKDPGELHERQLAHMATPRFNGFEWSPMDVVSNALYTQKLAKNVTRNNALLGRLSNKR